MDDVIPGVSVAAARTLAAMPPWSEEWKNVFTPDPEHDIHLLRLLPPPRLVQGDERKGLKASLFGTIAVSF